MALSAFADKSHKPTNEELQVLGASHSIWLSLINAVDERLSGIDSVWGFTSRSTGWGLRLRQKDRVILYMTPQHEKFLVSFALGEKAVAAVRRMKLSAKVLEAIDAAPRYAEGRGLRLEVSSKKQLRDLVALAQAKSEN